MSYLRYRKGLHALNARLLLGIASATSTHLAPSQAAASVAQPSSICPAPASRSVRKSIPEYQVNSNSKPLSTRNEPKIN